MLPNEFDYLHNLVKPLIQKSNKNRLFPELRGASCEDWKSAFRLLVLTIPCICIRVGEVIRHN
jgi:hypothetical protein